jgi:predicted transcriptional regulator
MGQHMGRRSQDGRGVGRNSPMRAERSRKAYELNLSGWNVSEIAKELGISHQTVRTDIKHWISQTVMPLAEDVKKQQLDRLELLWREAFRKSQKGDVPAMNAALKVLERQAKLLGLDINKIEFTQVNDPREIELIELINEARVAMKAEEDKLRQGTLPPR